MQKVAAPTLSLYCLRKTSASLFWQPGAPDRMHFRFYPLCPTLDTVLHPARRRAGDGVVVQSDGNRRSLSGVVERARMTADARK